LEKVLSKARRETSIKSIIKAIPTYVMSNFKLSMLLCDQIKQMAIKFYWEGELESKKLHWIRWEKLSESKEVGGLGFCYGCRSSWSSRPRVPPKKR